LERLYGRQLDKTERIKKPLRFLVHFDFFPVGGVEFFRPTRLAVLGVNILYLAVRPDVFL